MRISCVYFKRPDAIWSTFLQNQSTNWKPRHGYGTASQEKRPFLKHSPGSDRRELLLCCVRSRRMLQGRPCAQTGEARSSNCRIPEGGLVIAQSSSATSNLLSSNYSARFGPRDTRGAAARRNGARLHLPRKGAFAVKFPVQRCQHSFQNSAAFVNSIWPTLIISFGPPKTPTVPQPISDFGNRGRSGALRRAFGGAFRAERRPGLPKSCNQKIGPGSRAAGSNW
jgi:hypothetical protein